MKKNEAFFEAYYYNIFHEYDLIKKSIDTDESYIIKNKFNYARYLIFDYIYTCIENDRNNANYDNKENNEKIIIAGKLLFEIGGINYMKDEFIWSSIPNRYHHKINMLWKGIGEWGN